MKFEINLPGPGGWLRISAGNGINVQPTKEGQLIVMLPRDRWREVDLVPAAQVPAAELVSDNLAHSTPTTGPERAPRKRKPPKRVTRKPRRR